MAVMTATAVLLQFTSTALLLDLGPGVVLRDINLANISCALMRCGMCNAHADAREFKANLGKLNSYC
jgi:hypothetical protein